MTILGGGAPSRRGRGVHHYIHADRPAAVHLANDLQEIQENHPL